MKKVIFSMLCLLTFLAIADGGIRDRFSRWGHKAKQKYMDTIGTNCCKREVFTKQAGKGGKRIEIYKVRGHCRDRGMKEVTERLDDLCDFD